MKKSCLFLSIAIFCMMAFTSSAHAGRPGEDRPICELRTGEYKALVNDFGRHGQSARDILIPQVPSMRFAA